MLVIDILHYAALFQVSGSQTARQGAVLFPQPLLIDDQREAFLEAELAGFGGFQLSAEGVGQSVQFHGMQFLNGLLVEHVRSLCETSAGATAPAWWADRSKAVRGDFHGKDPGQRVRNRAGVGGPAIASESTSDFDRRRLAVGRRAGWRLPAAPWSRSSPSAGCPDRRGIPFPDAACAP